MNLINHLLDHLLILDLSENGLATAIKQYGFLLTGVAPDDQNSIDPD